MHLHLPYSNTFCSNRKFSTPSFKPKILSDFNDDGLKSSGLSAEDWLGAPEASSNRDLSMRCRNFKPISVGGAPFHCFDRLRDFISGTEELKSPYSIFRTKAQQVPQAKRRWVQSDLIGLHSLGHRNTSILFLGGWFRMFMKGDQILSAFSNLLLLFCFLLVLCGMWNEYTTRLFEK